MLAVCGKEKTSDLLTTSYVVSRRENVVRIPLVGVNMMVVIPFNRPQMVDISLQV